MLFAIDAMLEGGRIIGYGIWNDYLGRHLVSVDGSHFIFKTVSEAEEYARILNAAHKVQITGTVQAL
jgi:hypothetical protein